MARIASMFVEREDLDFLWLWANRLREETGLRVWPDHFVSVFVDDCWAGKNQGRLFGRPTEIERRVIERISHKRQTWRRPVNHGGLTEVSRRPSAYEVGQRVKRALKERSSKMREKRRAA